MSTFRGEDHLSYQTTNFVGPSAWPNPDGLIQFELDYILFADKKAEAVAHFSASLVGIGCHVSLGYTDAAILYHHVKDDPSERLFIHHVLNRCVEELGGRVSRVVVSGFDWKKSWFLCRLELEVAGRAFHIPCRDSDGYVSAIVAGCPFYISEAALRDYKSSS